MPDMQKLLQIKEKILEVIRQRGPELPVRIASAIGNNNLFTAAFMSELVGEKKLKLSHMRVGSSPLYYIEGQEEQLQKYAEYLNHKEKEAFHLLKREVILEDSEQEPAIRVALRNIKDFAMPIQIQENSQIKIFWKIHTMSNEQAKILIRQKLQPSVETATTETKPIALQIIEPKQEVAQKIEPAKQTPQKQAIDIFTKEKPSKKTQALKIVT